MPPDMVDTVLADPDARTAFATYAAAQVADNEAIDALGVGVDRFADLQTPTVVIEGELSPSHLRERADDLARTLPHASVVTLPGQGHVAHLAAPDLLATTVRDAARRLLGA